MKIGIRCAAIFTIAGLVSTEAVLAVSPWTAIEELRRHLIREGPLSADFVQIYLPAGFSTGDEERGHLAVALPDCLRWDYAEPYPKSFLVCGEDFYSWNAEDGYGQKYRVDAEQEPGLDLLILSTEKLRLRYNAESKEGPGGKVEVVLLPVHPHDNVVEARMTLDRAHQRILVLSYRDPEGNLTRFEISDYRRGVGSDSFAPPTGIEWEEGGG